MKMNMIDPAADALAAAASTIAALSDGSASRICVTRHGLVGADALLITCCHRAAVQAL